MKTNLKPFWIALLVCGLLPSNLFAMGGRVTSPIIVVRKPAQPGVPQPMKSATREQFQTLLFQDFDKAFVSGYFINWMTWLYFSGDAATLSRMLDELSRTEGVRFNLRFSTKAIAVASPFESKPDARKKQAGAAQWMILHNSSDQSIWITIHAGEGGVDLERLELPAMTGRAGEVITDRILKKELLR